jgi:hypothetical protein
MSGSPVNGLKSHVYLKQNKTQMRFWSLIREKRNTEREKETLLPLRHLEYA